MNGMHLARYIQEPLYSFMYTYLEAFDVAQRTRQYL